MIVRDFPSGVAAAWNRPAPQRHLGVFIPRTQRDAGAIFGSDQRRVEASAAQCGERRFKRMEGEWRLLVDGLRGVAGNIAHGSVRKFDDRIAHAGLTSSKR